MGKTGTPITSLVIIQPRRFPDARGFFEETWKSSDFIANRIPPLLEAARAIWKERQDVLFHHISTDEGYGSLGAEGAFVEATPQEPRSPYSGSKAASDHFVSVYHHTYGLPVTISNCSNNYGP